MIEFLVFMFRQWIGYRKGDIPRQMPRAEVVLDSVSPDDVRLTTMLVVMHRFVLAEFNTHRVFSRNSESSRAVPVRLRIARVLFDPAFPVEWGANQKGMQAYVGLSPFRIALCRFMWRVASWVAVGCVIVLYILGLHKQLTNRLLEPFLWHTAVVTSTEWINFFEQRSTYFTRLAQPELAATADRMYEALELSSPTALNYGDWHMPFTVYADGLESVPVFRVAGAFTMVYSLWQRQRVSVARCAQSAYAKLGTADIEKDLKRYQNLVEAVPMHASPLEHVATPISKEVAQTGNFTGWRQLRQTEEIRKKLTSQ